MLRGRLHRRDGKKWRAFDAQLTMQSIDLYDNDKVLYSPRARACIVRINVARSKQLDASYFLRDIVEIRVVTEQVLAAAATPASTATGAAPNMSLSLSSSSSSSSSSSVAPSRFVFELLSHTALTSTRLVRLRCVSSVATCANRVECLFRAQACADVNALCTWILTIAAAKSGTFLTKLSKFVVKHQFFKHKQTKRNNIYREFVAVRNSITACGCC
jgi:hypothetical protein